MSVQPKRPHRSISLTSIYGLAAIKNKESNLKFIAFNENKPINKIWIFFSFQKINFSTKEEEKKEPKIKYVFFSVYLRTDRHFFLA